MPHHSQLALFRHTTEHLERTDTELAEDNCAECQFVLAKQILNNNSNDYTDDEENAQGIYWLIKASKQGHLEATEMLKECFSIGRGINEHNIVDVKACVTSSIIEQQTVKLAKDIFITISDGEDFITNHQLQNALNLAERISAGVSAKTYQRFMQDIITGINNSTSQNWRVRSINNCEKIDESSLTLAARTYSKGQIPLLGRMFMFVELCFLFPCVYLSRCLFAVDNPLKSFGRFFAIVFEIVRFRNLSRLTLIHLYPRLTCLLIVLHYATMRTEFYRSPLITMTVHWLSLFTMIASTCEILYRKQEFHRFRSWTNLFIIFSEGSFVANEAEIRYSRNVLSSYAWFFVSLLIYLVAYVNDNLKLYRQTECAAFSLLFTLFTFYSFSVKDTFVLLKLARTKDMERSFSYVKNILIDKRHQFD